MRWNGIAVINKPVSALPCESIMSCQGCRSSGRHLEISMRNTSSGTPSKSVLEALLWGAYCACLGSTRSPPWQILRCAQDDMT